MKKIKVTRVSLTESLGTRSSAPPRSLLERQVSDLFGIRISGDSVWMMSQGFLRLPSVLRVALLIKPERSPWGFPQCLWDAPFEAVQSIQQESWMSEQRGPASPPTSLWLLGTPWTYAPHNIRKITDENVWKNWVLECNLASYTYSYTQT